MRCFITGSGKKMRTDLMKLKTAFLQLLPGKTLQEQYDIGKTACEKARKKEEF